VRIERTDHPVTAGLPSPWTRTDEWYNFRTNPRADVTVLATVDETTYSGGTMGADHPITWLHEAVGDGLGDGGVGGRAFYTAMGHAADAYADAPFRQLLLNALLWVAGR